MTCETNWPNPESPDPSPDTIAALRELFPDSDIWGGIDRIIEETSNINNISRDFNFKLNNK